MSTADDDLIEGESGQAHLRYRAGGPVALIYTIAHATGWWGDLSQAIGLLLLYVAFGVSWVGVVKLDLGSEQLRRHAVIVGDEILVALCLYFAPVHLAPLVFMPIFMTLGNGLRYGIRMALYSAGVACVTLGIVFAISPFWRQIPTVTLGILAGTFVVPVYGVGLNARLQRRRRALEAKAAALEVVSRTDPLTGLYNRAGFHGALVRALGDAGRSESGCAVLYVDLDGFKQINDTLGHDAGDLALVRVAELLRASIRSEDAAARLGGDEFAIVALGAHDADEAGRIARRILDGVAAIRMSEQPRLRLGASVGGCLVAPGERPSPDDVLRAADEAMFVAKRHGKGRFVVDGVEVLIREQTPLSSRGGS